MMYRVVHSQVAIPASIYLTPNTQSTRGHSSRFCIPTGSVDAFRHTQLLSCEIIRIRNTLPSFCCHHVHVFFYRGVQVPIGKRHSDAEGRLDPFCFYQHFLHVFICSVIGVYCFHHLMHICHVGYDNIRKRIYTLWKKKKNARGLLRRSYTIGLVFCRP